MIKASEIRLGTFYPQIFMSPSYTHAYCLLYDTMTLKFETGDISDIPNLKCWYKIKRLCGEL